MTEAVRYLLYDFPILQPMSPSTTPPSIHAQVKRALLVSPSLIAQFLRTAKSFQDGVTRWYPAREDSTRRLYGVSCWRESYSGPTENLRNCSL